MSALDFYVTTEDAITGAVLGSGPLESVSSWEYTARFDRAGTIAFTYDGSDTQAVHVTNTRIARAFALLDGVWTEAGAGIIDTIVKTPSTDGRVTCQASGLDLIRELSYRSVGQLEIGKPNGALHSTALAVLQAYAPAVPGWTFTPAADPGNDYIYARYDGESVLGALVYLAEKTGTHFYRGVDRELIFASSFENSGVWALGDIESVGGNRCAITSISQSIDTHELITRAYAWGSGNGKARLTLAATNRTAPTGYTLNKTLNYIESVSATALYGLRDFPAFEFKEITPISNTSANKRAAANMLFDSALMELRRRSSLSSQKTYELAVAGCDRLLRPLQTIGVRFRDPEQGIDIDEQLKILEATWHISAEGAYTTRLVVSTDDRWPESDESAAAERAVQGRVFQAHPQLGPNSYWENGTLYVGSDQTNHIAEFPFVLGPEVATIDRVRFRFKVTEALSFTSVTTGAISVPITIPVTTTVSVNGTINISHTHPLPNHQHTIVVAGGSAGTALGYNSGGGLAFLTKAAAGELNLNSTVYIGSTTSDGGGSTALALTGTGSGTGSGDVDLDLSDAITTSYGVYRAPTSRTFDMSELEYAINGGAWIALDTAIPVGSYYEIDITDIVQDPDTFVPLQENNLIEIRRADSAGLTIESSSGDGTKVGVVTAEAHGLALGETVTMAGTTYHDGTWTVVQIDSIYTFWTNQSGDTHTNFSGTATVSKSAMIYIKLGVVDFIQAVALV